MAFPPQSLLGSARALTDYLEDCRRGGRKSAEGMRLRELPFTPERVLDLLGT